MKRVALIGNCTTSLLVRELQGIYELYEAPGFNTWMQACLEPEALIAFKPDLLVILFDAPEHFGAATVASALSSEHAREWAAIQSIARALPTTTVLALDECVESWLTADLRIDCDIRGITLQAPELYDARLKQLAGMPFSLQGLQQLTKLIGEALVEPERKKVLALDLDGVLWQGVAGEEHVAPDREMLRLLYRFKDAGVILTILSKNNPADVEALLPKDLFSAQAINWNDKSLNLLDQAAALNLAPDAFVFVDDNPVERLAMSAALPQVAVAETLDLGLLFARYFRKRTQTAEDALRTASYQAATERAALKSRLDLADYLDSLQIETKVRPAQCSDIPRIAELSRKTHQFTINPRPWEPDAIEADLEHFYVAHTRDRFADEGLIAFLRLEGETLTDFAMSCRVMGRKVEETILSHFTIRHVYFTATNRNTPAKDFLIHAKLLS